MHASSEKLREARRAMLSQERIHGGLAGVLATRRPVLKPRT